ncbi:SIMPL domain-containing protein [Halomonas cerina]|uniref:SIMPL domain-containing protein n=1 Tax=Halomonas cerina TaxID=447424 RepID=A0A839V5Y1_9GAMM|nr:SIMPL domain-containing protein [Halomonas cerina]MBB3190802.1 hypothetical protein [Halomonas cerina]
MLFLRPRPALLAALLAVTALGSITAQAGTTDSPRRLEVQARAELEVVPDQATLSARLWEHTPAVARKDDTTDPDALREARERLEARAATLIETLEAAGVHRDAIQAGSLRVQPETLHEPPRPEGKAMTLSRTRLERPFEIELAELDTLPTVLDALTDAGVNALDGVTYDLADRDAATDRALTQALQKAQHKAKLMATTLGITLGEVLGVSETQSPVYQPRMMAMSADARESTPQAEYRPGTITLEAGVNVSWEIAQ